MTTPEIADDSAAVRKTNGAHVGLGPSALWHRLGPGLITGAADDDPSGIATYSQAGAQFGYGTLWTLFLTTPLMIAVQVICARIGEASGHGIIANLRHYHGRPLLSMIVALLFAANIFNIAADISAMGDALRLVVGGPANGYSILFVAIVLALQIFVPYHRYAPLLKWLTLALFAYVAAALTIDIPWRQVLIAFIWTEMSLSRPYLLIIVAVLGTTISPYLFFWQAAQEVEEARLAVRQRASTPRKVQHADAMRRITIDTTVGMIFSNVIASFIVITAAAALHAHGITDIQTSAQAADALRPIAGHFAFMLFALGIIGTGLLAVPVLAGSAAYAASELFGWTSTLEAKPTRARGFYAIIGIAVISGVVLDFTGADPIRMLVWSAVANGFVAVPMMVLLMRLASKPDAVGLPLPGRLLRAGGWMATALMGLVVVALILSSMA